MKKIFSIILLASFALVSCVDTIILPDDKTVEEDFWQTKQDVQSMINGAYTAMASEAVQQRLVIWSSRSDELNVNTSLSNSTLNQFDSNNLQTDNTYNNWGSLYSVINTCNLVISKSESVMDIDPNYLEGDHYNTVAQMTALRSLCYFYLIRAFRDVPFTTQPYKESSQELNLAQSPAGVVLDSIIGDLEKVKDNALSTDNVTSTTEKHGCFTRNSIYALLADCYLWRASVLHQMSDYKRCVELCDMVRNARSSANSAHFGFGTQLDDDGYDLNSYSKYYNIFAEGGNDDESLLELEFSDNTALCNCYYKYKSATNAQPWFYTSSVYGTVKKDAATTVSSNVFNQLHTGDVVTDIRGFESIFNFNNASDDNVQIRKYVGTKAIGTTTATTLSDRSYSNYKSNWVVYRATDVMLMKAEALVQIAKLQAQEIETTASQFANAKSLSDSLSIANSIYDTEKAIGANLVTGMRQVQIVNTRAQSDGESLYDSTAYKFSVEQAETSAYVKSVASYVSSVEKTCDELELEVMNERAREFCFEGKRWFDMLRFNYRHVTGVNYYSTMIENAGNQPKNSDDMLTLMARKYTTRNGTALVANILTEPYLYMPVLKSEIEVNSLLVQNPAYKDRATAEKNY